MAGPMPCLLVAPDPPRFTIRHVNQAYVRATHVPAEQLIGKGYFECFTEETEEARSRCVGHLRKSFSYVLEHQDAHELPVQKCDVYLPRELGGDYEQRYWKIHNAPIIDTDGQLGFILHTIDDQTGQVLAESDRRHFADVVSDMLVKVGFDGYFKHINARCESILGWTPAELQQTPWIDFVHPDDAAATLDVMELVKKGNPVHHFENRYRCKDGSYRWLNWNTLTVPEEDAIYCVAGDITQPRRLHAVAEGQKHALELSVQGATLPFILERLALTMEANTGSGVRASILLLSEDGRQLFTGAAPSLPAAYVAAIDGMETGEGQGSCGTAAALASTYIARDIATDPYWENFRELALRHGLRACWSIPILSSTGDVFGTFALYYAQPRRPSASERQLVDILSRTAGVVIERERNQKIRVRTERQMIKARNEAQAANLAKSEFLANMSHEIRTPMNVVVGISNILSQHEQLSEEQSDLVHTLQHSAASLLDLINDLLDISTIEAHGIELDRVAFRMEQLLEDVADMMRPRAEEKGLTFTVSGQDALDGRFIGDPARLRQVLLNLCSNAVKFTDRGKVELFVSRQPGEQSGTALVSIGVTDTGIGIRKNKHAAIFQKFTQADSSISRKFGGTGLGLSITQRLVGIMEGTISVKSKFGEGSTFTVTVPLTVDNRKASSPMAEAPAAERRGKASGGNVLLVEDFEPNAIITSRYLRVFGYPYEIVTNGLQAVEKVRTNAHRVVLMDIQMPELDGYEATRRIRAHERANGLRRIPIIAMTANALSGDRDHCLEAGMDDYLAKPFSSAELREKLGKYLGEPDN
ncbi:PAS domain-containing hybrid sensor histidine kinase/response regulator [Neolewinella xylanilytica]|nr:ATP-binding protein [Neolewinella xylanilytica]